ncbi:glycosyltransferase [Microbacterium sp. NPDC077184]|uniref:glycosyltransferase n=1 Tax=Microbacterium sp. NPDC077184 TaxID=3154764 RepID=UPI003447ADA2
MTPGPTVLVFPAWRSNPYLNMLSLSARASGYRFDGETEFFGFLRAIRRLSRGDIVHVHWTSPIAQAALSGREARGRVNRFVRALRRSKRRGVKLVWTVHNRLPHELDYPDDETRIYGSLAELSDAIHVMTPDTANVIKDVTELPLAKIRVIPHPSYQGIYDTGMFRDDARDHFGLTDEEVAVLFLGQIRPYKGVTTLLRAIERANRSDGKRLVLLLAGHTTPTSLAELEPVLPERVRTITHLDFVPDSEIATWFQAADVAVFPYRQILNSGSVHLAATFGVPALLPREPHLELQYAGQRWVSLFDTVDSEASLAEHLGDPRLTGDVTREDFRAYIDAVSPWRVSALYKELLDALTRPADEPIAGAERQQ